LIRERFDLDHYGLGVRNGNCSFTGATIAHVHAHILVGDPSLEPEVPVRMRFSSRPR
jgi:diadenosine tetraphosphate (Ap4A) HIT family hydrolase